MKKWKCVQQGSRLSVADLKQGLSIVCTFET
jgi:hypothetical protein